MFHLPIYVGDVMFRRIMIIFSSRADEVEMIKPIFIFHITIVHTIDGTDCRQGPGGVRSFTKPNTDLCRHRDSLS